jgi:SGNH domain (fused to AT3 domains)
VTALPSEPSLARSEVKGAGALEKSTTIQNRARAVVPSPLRADKDRGRPVDDGCLVDGTPKWSRCIYGDKRSKTTVVLFGDSHAFQYFSPIERIAKRRGWRLVEQTRQGCPPADTLVWATFLGRPYPECGTWHGDALKRIARAHPAMIIVAGSAHYGVVQDGQRLSGPPNLRALSAGYGRFLTQLRDITARVVYLTDSPRPPQYIPDCVAQNMHHLRRCAFPRARAVENEQALKAAANGVDGVHVVDPTPEFCPRDLCAAVIGNVLVYRNSGHVTDTYVRTMTPWLSDRVPRLKKG